jgi:hypothetical protein
MLNTLDLIKEFRLKKHFNTRGVPFAKKMWRDGYNKAIDEIIIFLEMKENGYTNRN